MHTHTKIVYIALLSIFLQMIFALDTYSNIPPPWRYKNTGANHTILIPGNAPVNLNNDSLETGDYIGVFYDSLGNLVCAGYSMWEHSVTAMAAWGEDEGLDGFSYGETFKWKVWDSSEGKEYNALAKYNDEDFISLGNYTSNGMSGLVSLYAFPEQEIELHIGWNYFSSYISPIVSNMDSFVKQFNTSLILMNDFDNVIIAEPGIIQIPGYYIAGDSYKIKLAKDTTITMFGVQAKANDTIFTITENFQALPYLREQPATVEALFHDNYQQIYILKDEHGNLLWPEMGQYNVQNLYPGKAYEIITESGFDFSFPPSDSLIDFNIQYQTNIEEHYKSTVVTGLDMCLGISYYAWQTLPETGDEVGIFNSEGLLVGSGVFTGSNMGIILRGDDITTAITDGLLSGEVFKLKLWGISTNFEDDIIVLDWDKGDSIYAHNKISIISNLEIKQDPVERAFGFELLPDFGNNYNLEISMNEQGYVEFNMYNLLGQFAINLISEELPIGKHNINLNLSGIASGVYLFILNGEKERIMKKLPILK
ncbi:MAG: hypothetical protein U9R19_11655 [Bacteroidota bacterium]|nr:hypothetical protein [Bacteroidota bacterium]